MGTIHRGDGEKHHRVGNIMQALVEAEAQKYLGSRYLTAETRVSSNVSDRAISQLIKQITRRTKLLT